MTYMYYIHVCFMHTDHMIHRFKLQPLKNVLPLFEYKSEVSSIKYFIYVFHANIGHCIYRFYCITQEDNKVIQLYLSDIESLN